MKVSEIINKLDLECVTGIMEDSEIKNGYVSDMLSDVMGNAPSESVLITILGHENVVAVAMLRDISLIILAKNMKPNPVMVEKAKDEGITVAISKQTAFDICGRLYAEDIKGEVE